MESKLSPRSGTKRNFVIHLVERAFMFFGENLFLFSQEIVIGCSRTSARARFIGVASARPSSPTCSDPDGRWSNPSPEESVSA